MVLRNLLLLVALAILAWRSASCQQVSAQQFSPAQQRLLTQIAAYGMVESQYVSRVGAASEQYARFDSLKRISSKVEIIAFAKLPSPVVRVYAFNYLLETRDAQNAFSIVRANSKNNTAFKYQFGCISGTSALQRYFYVNFNYVVHAMKLFISAEQQAFLDKMYKKLPDRDAEDRSIE